MSNVIDSIESGFNRLARWLIALVAASIGLFAVLIPFNLVLINLHYGGMWWLHEAIEYALYVGVFIGAPWVLQQGAHIRVDLASIALPRTIAVYLERIIDMAGCGLCILLFTYGIRAAKQVHEPLAEAPVGAVQGAECMRDRLWPVARCVACWSGCFPGWWCCPAPSSCPRLVCHGSASWTWVHDPLKPPTG